MLYALLATSPASPEEANALHKRASGVDELNCLNKAGGCKRSEEGTFLNGWGDHLGFPGQTSSAFQFLAAWSAKDAYIGGRGVYMEYTWTTWSIHGVPNVHSSGERSMHGVYMDYMEYSRSAKDAYFGGRGLYMEYTWTTWSIHGVPRMHTSGGRGVYMEYTWTT